MAKKSSAQVEAMTEVVDAKSGLPVNAFSAVAVVAAPSEGALTFEMYCSARRIPVQHRAGKKAFTKVRSATLSEWDKIFRKY